MNIVRCVYCGEITDYEKRQVCKGCGEPLSAEPAGKRPHQIAPVQREANADINSSRNVLTALVATALLGAALLFARDHGFMGAALARGLTAAFLFPLLAFLKRGGTATPEVSAAGGPPPAPKAGPLPPAVGAPRPRPRPAPVRTEQSLGSSLEQGCGMVLKVIGIMIAVLVGLAALGFVVLWIACMTSSFGHF